MKLRVLAANFVFSAVFCAALAVPVRAGQFDYSDPMPPNLQDIRTRQCATSTDCVSIAMSPCGGPVAINRRYVYAVQGWNEYLYPRTQCNVWKQNPLLTPACLGGVCGFSPTNSSNQAALFQRRNEDPLYCEQPSDCTAATDACGHKTAVNQRHFMETQARQPATCQSYVETRPLAREDCAANACVVILGNSPPPPP